MDRRLDGRINIGGDAMDPSYRYTMSPICVQHQPPMRTVIVNLRQIAKDLQVDIRYLASMFKYALGCQTILDSKSGALTLNGLWERKQLSDALNHFINNVILCAQCQLPETSIVLSHKKLRVRCKACSASRYLVAGAGKYEEHLYKCITRLLNTNPPRV